MKYMLICSNCGNKFFSDGKSMPFVELPVAPTPLRANGVTKETKQFSKKTKCPKCGYLFRVVKLEEKKDDKIRLET
jgi:DNA-directed RNA polymerase subunit RPC12/RpoP